MPLFTLEHSKSAYRADFALYAGASTALSLYLIFEAPHALRLELAALAMAGLAGWTLVEYGLHRFVLHGLPPFSTWHAEHHRRPTALICTPTVLSGSLIVLLVFLPALLLSDLWRASAVTCGMLIGYLGYTITHHAIHHWRSDSAWLRKRRIWHALHHTPNGPAGHFGVTSAFWDYLLGSRQRAEGRLRWPGSGKS